MFPWLCDRLIKSVLIYIDLVNVTHYGHFINIYNILTQVIYIKYFIHADYSDVVFIKN